MEELTILMAAYLGFLKVRVLLARFWLLQK